MEFFFNDGNVPFMWAVAILAAIAVLEVAGLFAGFSFLGDSDGDVGVDQDAALEASSNQLTSFAHWLGFGKIPVLAIIALLCGVFGSIGLMINMIAINVFGFMLPILLTVPASFVLTLPVVSQLAEVVGKLMPTDETNTIRLDELVGSTATITNGTATYNISAPALAYDKHGVMHTFSVRACVPGVSITERTKVRLDSYSDQGFFYVTPIN